MKKTILFFLSIFWFSVVSQSDLLPKYQKAYSLYQMEDLTPAYSIFKEIEPKWDHKDTTYEQVLWYYVQTVSQLESKFRLNEKFDSSLHYGFEAMKLIEKGKSFFDEKFASRQYWMYKNFIVSYFGLGKPDEAKKYQDILYAAYKDKKLPKGLNEYYNFNYYRWEGKNIWGYEWYPELGDPETEGSFSKIVYYVYSTNPDGSDKDQLYRLHVLKFHKMDDSIKFDYVLTKRLETAVNEVSGTLYAYTYVKKIDYTKLMKDIKEVLKGNYEPDTKSIINKKK